MGADGQDNLVAQRIVQAAVRLFAQKGYSAASTREIVEAAGVTKPMLYYYFDSKVGLCQAALRFYLDPFYERLRQVLHTAQGPRELLVDLVWAHLDFCQVNKEFARLFYALYFGPDEQSAELDLNQFKYSGRDLVAQAVDRVGQAGLIDPARGESLVIALHGMINILVIASLKDGLEPTPALAEQVVADLLDGFRPK